MGNIVEDNGLREIKDVYSLGYPQPPAPIEVAKKCRREGGIIEEI